MGGPYAGMVWTRDMPKGYQRCMRNLELPSSKKKIPCALKKEMG